MTKEKRLAYYVGCLLPLVSVLLYQGLPDDLPMQFNSQGDADYTFPKIGQRRLNYSLVKRCLLTIFEIYCLISVEMNLMRSDLDESG